MLERNGPYAFPGVLFSVVASTPYWVILHDGTRSNTAMWMMGFEPSFTEVSKPQPLVSVDFLS